LNGGAAFIRIAPKDDKTAHGASATTEAFDVATSNSLALVSLGKALDLFDEPFDEDARFRIA
jgi:hypothetical protein